MRNYNSTEWRAASKKADLPLNSRDTLELDVVADGSILLSGITLDGEVIPLKAGEYNLHIKTKFEGFTALEITSKNHFGYRFMGRPGQLGEPMDDRTPPPPKEPTNILQQMRSVIRQELADKRESFLTNDTPFSGYEVDDDSDDFEEEILANRQQQLDKLKTNPQPASKPTDKPTEKPADDPKPKTTSEPPPSA